MDVTLCNASFGTGSTTSLTGSVFVEKTSPGKTKARLCMVSPDGSTGLPIWSAYRTRQDAEGQRQLEKAMMELAQTYGNNVIKIVPTKFTRRL